MTPPRGRKPSTDLKQARVPVCLRLLPEANAKLAKLAREAGVAKGEIVEALLSDKALRQYLGAGKSKGGK